MPFRPTRPLRLAALLSLAALGPARSGAPAESPVVLWAWERAEDLRFLEPGSTAIASLVATVELRDGGFSWRDQLNPHALGPGPRPIAVVRIESPHGASLLPPATRPLAEALAAAARDHPELQLDYDARRSERAGYLELLRQLRARLPASTRLSVTALASWCLGDRWLSGAPIDEAVPMIFRLGADASGVRSRLAAGTDFAETLCRGSYGLSTDEPWPPLRAGRRRWIFHPQPWDEASSRAALEGSAHP